MFKYANYLIKYAQICINLSFLSLTVPMRSLYGKEQLEHCAKFLILCFLKVI